MSRATALLRTFGAVLVLALIASAPAHADVASGFAWLQARQDAAQGVHRASDLANRVDTNGETYATVIAAGRTADFAATAARAIADRDETLQSVARRASLKLGAGQSAGDDLATLLAAQLGDGSIPSAPGLAGEPLTTALALAALDRAGRGSESVASRALGYLVNAQQADGGWVSAPGNVSSVYASAEVARVLAAFRNRFAIAANLTRAVTFLENRRQANAWGEAFESAHAIDALLALNVARAGLQPAVVALASAQAANGSWSDDAYVTAVVLRVLWRWDQPVVDPTVAALTGRVLAADTDLPISGARLSLAGPGPVELTSNDSGRVQSNTLVAGSYHGTLTYPGMRTIEFDVTLVDGRTLDLGDIRMYQGTTPSGDFGLVRGRVTNAETGAPIAGAILRLDTPPTEVTADADGNYQFLQVPVGPIRIVASAANFSTVTATTDIVARAIVEFSPRLEPITAPTTGAIVRGRIVHGTSAAPLAGVQVAVTSGAPVVSTTTDAAGNYSLAVDPGAAVTLLASLAGFDSVSITSALVANEVLVFSPRLYPTGESPDGANRARIEGIVVNQANRRPIANALIVVSDPAGQQAIRSDSNGHFAITGIQGPVTRLALSADAFDPATIAVSIRPLEVRNVGTIGLKPIAVDYYFSDLAIVASTLSETEPDRYALDRSFTIEIANRGTSSTTQDFDVIAFVDADGDGEKGASEPEAGRVRVDDDLAVGGSVDVDIAAAAQLTFRDAPIAFVADANNEIPEENEDNNTGTSLLGCRVTPSFIGAGNVYEAWRWRGLAANPTINSLNATPAVAQMTDDNGDGVINEYDIPEVIFVAGQRNTASPGATALVVLDGKTGAERWTNTSYRLSQFSSPAVGDLDNDGIAEIVVVTGYREQILAFEHDGTLKWRVNTGGPGIPVPLFPPPPFVYDEPAIVNLEGDNEAEVVYGRIVFRGSNGEKLWEGEFDAGGEGGKPRTTPLAKAGGIGSIAADVNLDGMLEVIAGRSLYDVNGNTIWHRADIVDRVTFDLVNTPMNQSGFNAVGNFDLDDFAEIVLSIDDELYLLEHTGETIWGPKFAPDFGQLGAPSVADLDSDGLPEIMISSNARLTIFESDGTVKWTATILDNSGVTSATVFDFENDGLYEVVHMDERDFRIFDALTGTLLYETRNTSRTVYEYPVVADIDGDKQAEIIITGYDDDFVAGTTPGIRVFKARNGAWADAGSVWGSHSFHIDDIEEDSTLPLLETPSWLTHNTYRVQRSPLPDPLGMPDFTVGGLELVEQGAGRNPAVQVRVGNAGPVDAHEPPWIGVYRGDPAAGGTLLAEQRLDTLAPARFQIVNLGDVALTGTGDLYAVVDQRARANECRETNNARHIPFAVGNGRGDLAVASDRPTYRPGDAVQFTGTVVNVGGAPAGYTIEWFVRDSGGRVTAELAPRPIAPLAPGATSTATLTWSTGGVLAGSYVLVGRLRDGAGNIADSATTPFVIAGDASGAAGAVTLDTARATYASGEVANLTYGARNLSSTEVIRLPEVIVTVTGPGGYVFTRTFQHDDLFANAAVGGDLALDGAIAPGTYAATARLRSRLTSFEYATTSLTFERLADATQALRGQVDVARATLPRGDAQTCLYSVRNAGTAATGAVRLRQRVVALDSGAVLYEQIVTTTLLPGADYVANERLLTGAWTPGEHGCTIEAESTPGVWRTLDAEPFALEGAGAPAVFVTPTTGLVTDEAGLAATFTVVLATPPTADVTIGFSVTDATEISLPVTTVTFTPATWSVARTITVVGVDDALVDGDQPASVVVAPAVSTDAAYTGIDGADVAVTNRDDDGVQLIVTPTSLATSEPATTATFTVRASAAPTAPVTIALANPDATEWQVSSPTVVLDATNWQTGVVTTVTAVDDAIADGTQSGTLVLAAATSTDVRYAGVDPADVALTNADDDGVRIEVAPTTVSTTEGGAAATFTVRLSEAPTGVVVVPIGPVDASEWQVLATEVRLDAATWTGVPVVVSPVDDTLADGDQTATLALGVAQSPDVRYAGRDPVDVTLVNGDDDGARIVVTPTSGLVVSETGTTATFTVALTEAPTAEVRIALATGDATELAVAPAEVVFTRADFAARIVTITGVDDPDVDGNVAASIALAPAVSTDARYGAIDPPNVLATNLDDETVQVVVSPDGAIETRETGTTATFTVRLSTAPTAAVRIALVNPDATEWLLDATEIELTPANGTAPVSVTVTGRDDALVDGDVAGAIRLLPATSTDVRYAGFDARDVAAINRDDDVAALPAALVVTPLDTTTSEAGDGGTILLALNRAPTVPVSVTITSSDVGEVAIDTPTLTFTPADALTPRTVALRGVDDPIADGTQSATVRIAVTASADTAFAALPPFDVPAVNVDDEAVEAALPIPAGGGVAPLLLALFLLLTGAASRSVRRERSR